MHDPFENSEIAAASQDRGGLSGDQGRVAFSNPFQCRTPRAANSRGVRVFAIRSHVDRAFRQTPICQYPRRPGPSGRAPHR